jgi:hypothetical protein
MKVYPKQGPGCSVVGTAAGTADLNTHRKWVWAYVEAIAKLVDMVVSLLYFFAFVYGKTLQIPCFFGTCL